LTNRKRAGSAVVALALLAPATTAWAANTSTQTSVANLATGEAKVVTLLHHYKVTAGWKAQFNAAIAKQTADLAKLNSALAVKVPTSVPTSTSTTAPTTTTAGVDPTTTTISVTVSDAPSAFDLDATASPARPAPGVLSITISDVATGQTVGTWTDTTYSPLLNAPPDLWLDWDISGGTTDTLTIDPTYTRTGWTGPSLVTMSSADLLDSEVGVQAVFAGQPGYGPSESSVAVL
jgi:hypothetical protein